MKGNVTPMHTHHGRIEQASLNALGKQSSDYPPYLLNTLVSTEDDFRKPLPQASVVIDDRIAQILKGKLTKPLDRLVYTLVTVLYLLQ